MSCINPVSNHAGKKLQGGSALIVSLIILLVMTITGIQGITSTTLEEKMSGNFLDNQVAFEAAESALSAGERWIVSRTSAPATSGTVDTVAVLGSVRLNDAAWWSANGTSTGADIGGVYSQPMYFIELQQIDRGVMRGNVGAPYITYYYRITARGSGATANSVVYLQSVVAKRG